MAASPKHMVMSIDANSSQNHPGTCCAHTENMGGASGGGQLGGQTINGRAGGVVGGSTGRGGRAGSHVEKSEVIDMLTSYTSTAVVEEGYQTAMRLHLCLVFSVKLYIFFWGSSSETF